MNPENLSEEIQESGGLLLADGPWDPLGDEPRPLEYTMRKKGERTYAKNAAVDTTFQVKVDDRYHGQRLRDIRRGLHGMFEDILLIHHDGLHDPIVVPLRPWDRLNVDVVMEHIEKVLNSHQELSMNDSFDITIGAIDLPKGNGRRPITSLQGDKNSIQIKKSLVTIDNNDQLCMARAIGVGWAKLNLCTKEEWNDLTRYQKSKSNLELTLEHRKVPESHYMNLRKTKSKDQKDLALAISRLAGVPLDRPASLNDIEAFEEVLNSRVMVVSARLGNKFITSPSTDEQPCVYIYLVDNCHFHTISNITGFFSSAYFCSRCLKHYANKERHECEVTCIMCKTTNCPKTESPVTCDQCHMTCRSTKYGGVRATDEFDCTECQPSRTCTPCSKCQRCKTSWCGKATHKPNFVVAHTVCPTCIDRPVMSESRCQDCGTRCSRCEDLDVPCTGTACGLREVVFQGQDTARTFSKWLFSSQHKYFKTVCHNMKGYDGYFLLEYLIDQ